MWHENPTINALLVTANVIIVIIACIGIVKLCELLWHYFRLVIRWMFTPLLCWVLKDHEYVEVSSDIDGHRRRTEYKCKYCRRGDKIEVE